MLKAKIIFNINGSYNIISYTNNIKIINIDIYRLLQMICTNIYYIYINIRSSSKIFD